jgi:hypothetical protein
MPVREYPRNGVLVRYRDRSCSKLRAPPQAASNLALDLGRGNAGTAKTPDVTGEGSLELESECESLECAKRVCTSIILILVNGSKFAPRRVKYFTQLWDISIAMR